MVVKENEIVVNSGGKNVSLIINSSDQAGQGGRLAFVLGHGASGANSGLQIDAYVHTANFKYDNALQEMHALGICL